MKVLTAIKYIFQNLRLAASLSVFIVLAVVAAEALQHIVEYNLGMYDSRKAFNQMQGDTVRMSFGILKAVTVIAACYIVPKKLTQDQGPPPKHGSFRANMIRRLWDPRMGMIGLMVMFILAAPIIFLHYKLSYLAMGHSAAPFILALDSVLIGFLALVMGVSVWADDRVEYETRQTSSG